MKNYTTVILKCYTKTYSWSLISEICTMIFPILIAAQTTETPPDTTRKQHLFNETLDELEDFDPAIKVLPVKSKDTVITNYW